MTQLVSMSFATPGLLAYSGNNTEPFDVLYEINDKAKGTWSDLTITSSTFWVEVKHKVAEKFNVYPASLQLQYRFSNEKANSLPFELNTEQAYVEMQDKYERLMFTGSGKLRKLRAKPIIVQLFDKEAEGISGSKGKGRVRS